MKQVKMIAALLLVGVVASILATTASSRQFTVDGYDYATMMLMDTGLPQARAEREAERFFATQPVARIPLMAPHLHGTPQYWGLFSVRRVDPWIASLLYRYRGFEALVDVSRAAYVVTALLIVVLAARFAPLPYGVILAIAVSAFPPWREIGSEALTDALAVALTTATLLAALACLRRRTLWNVALFAALCALASFTRPIPYVILGGTMVAAVAAPRIGHRTRLTTAALLTGIAALCCAAVEVALTHAHAPGLRWIVADTYARYVASGYAVQGETLRAFFVHQELAIASHAFVKGILSVVPVLAIAGAYLRRSDPAMPLLAGACAATWFGALVDPDPFDTIRCVVMPVAPAMAAFAAAGLAAVLGVVPGRLGPVTHRLRYFIPRRVLARTTTVKE